MINKHPYLSVVVPIFNEQERISNLSKIIYYLKKQKYIWEVIVVNDGSTDRTYDILGKLQKKLGLRIITYDRNQGKGFAVKTGMLEAKGIYRLFLDIDLSTPIDEIDKLLPMLSKYPIVIGSRKMKGAKVITRQSSTREFLGRVFTLLSQITLQVNVSDFTCGFKCFTGKSANQIFKKQRINRWGFDSEILFIGKIHGNVIKEVPIKWKNHSGTKVRFPKDLINSLVDLFKIRINYSLGLYQK